MAILEQIGVHYEEILIDIDKRENRSTNYLDIHPLGLLPAMCLPDGSYVYESAGICMYLIDQFPDCRLAPEIGNPDRALYNQWLFYLATTIYPAYVRYYRPEKFSSYTGHKKSIQEIACLDLNKSWQIIDKALIDRSCLLGSVVTGADIYLMMLTTWYHDQDEFSRMFPNLRRAAASTANYPGVVRALGRHNIHLFD